MRYKINPDMRKLSYGTWGIVGNIKNGNFMVLDKEGCSLFEKIENDELDELELTVQQREILNYALEDNIVCTGDDIFYDKIIPAEIVSAYVHFNDKCNLNCIGCYSRTIHRNAGAELTTNEWKNVLYKLHEKGVETLFVSGGEPLLRKDIIELLKYAKDELKFSKIILATNGTIGNKEIFEELALYTDSVSVSIDGFDDSSADVIRDEGTFKRVCENLLLMKRANMNLSLLPTIHKKNYMYIDEYLKFAEKYEVPINFSLLTCSNKEEMNNYILTEEDFLQFVIKYSDKNINIEDVPSNVSNLNFRATCGAGENMISVNYKGDVFPCHMLQKEELCMGNILHDEISTVIESQRAKEVSSRNVDANEECAGCDVRYLCGGGCKARSYNENGKFSCDKYCSGYKRLLGNIKDYFAKMLIEKN